MQLVGSARSWAAGVAVAALAATSWVATPAEAAPASGPDTSVTFFLRAPHPAALTALAARPATSRSDRLAAVARLLPTSAQRTQVVSTLRREGFTVSRQTSWSVTATAPQTTVTDLLGARPTLSKNPTAAERAAATGALPRLPATLAPYVAGAYPTVGGPAPFHHSATSSLTGADVRNADTPAGVTPSTGGNDGGVTVATLQLADFDSADLTHYATSNHLADPVAAGRYRAVKVDGGPSSQDDASGGDIEVDLDQESILSTAPSAKQQAYFAPNTDAGFGDVFAAVLDDVTGDAHATAADPHITALSVSWGECESLSGADAINAYEPIIDSLVAAGVTVFAASGDDGIYDCRSNTGTGLDNSQADVDYPASSPAVVGVGGTNLSAAASAPNTGSNWTETSWTCTDAVSCQNTVIGTGGTGGGASGSAYDASSTDGTADFAGFSAPLWQQRTLTGTFGGQAKRLVPDIAADGDPGTGFVVYTSDPQYVVLFGGNTGQVGGTSLAAPLSAAQLTNTLADAGLTHGVGDIHAALYSAYAATHNLAATNPKRAFRDVTEGSNGAAGDAATDPSVAAAAGFDTNTGLGGVLWSALTPYLTASQGPAISARLTVAKGSVHAKHVSTAATWTATAAPDAIDTTTVQVTRGSTQVGRATTSAGRLTFTALRGATYTISVTATDIAGHSSTKVTSVHVPAAKPKHHHKR